MNRLKRALAVLAVVIGIAGPVTAIAASSAGAQPIGCSFYTIKIVSSGVSDCFVLNAGTSQNVQLPDSTSIFDGAYSGMKFVWVGCPNYTAPSCAQRQQRYTTQIIGGNQTVHPASPIDIIQIIYPS